MIGEKFKRWKAVDGVVVEVSGEKRMYTPKTLGRSGCR